MKKNLLLGILLCTSAAVSAFESRADETAANPTRALRLSVGRAALFSDPFASGASAGPGLNLVYEFLVKPTTAVGVLLAHRNYGGTPALSQLGYGLTLRHALRGISNETFTPYLAYGLLFQVSRLSGHTGSGTAHDTMLAAGTDIRAGGVSLFVDLSYHYSRLRYFDTPSLKLDYWEPSLGWKMEW